jgi:hypothetical protein
MDELWQRWPPDLAAWTPADWSAGGTVVTAVIALLAALFAWLQVRHARRLREDQARPFVIVYFELSPVWTQAVNLVVENVGSTVARDVTFSFSEPLRCAARTGDINEPKLFKEGVTTLPPGMRYSTLFDLGPERIEAKLPVSYDVTVSYRGRGRKPETERYTLDLSLFFGLEKFTEYGIHHGAKALHEIEKTLRKWTGKSNRLKVWVKDEDYDMWADAWQRKQGGAFPSLGRPYPAGRNSPSQYDSLREPLVRHVYWAVRLRLQRRLQPLRDRREENRLAKLGRPDLAKARKTARGAL